MSTDTNKAIVRRYELEPWNYGKIETFDELCGPGYTVHFPDGTSAGVEEVKMLIADLRRKMPDLVLSLQDMLAEGDLVAYRWSWSGTEYATSKRIVSQGLAIVRVENDKIIDDRTEGGSKTPLV